MVPALEAARVLSRRRLQVAFPPALAAISAAQLMQPDVPPLTTVLCRVGCFRVADKPTSDERNRRF